MAKESEASKNAACCQHSNGMAAYLQQLCCLNMLRFQVGSGSSGASVAASACCSELSVSLGRVRAFFGGRPQYSERVTAFFRVWAISV